MKQLFKYCLSIGFFILIVLVSLDLLYTYVFLKVPPRNQIQQIMSLKNKSVDYVFLGSSRVQNSIVTKTVEEISNKSAINLGIQGAKLADTRLLIELLIENEVQIEKLFVQVDYIFNFESSSVMVKPQLLPYVHHNNVIKSYLEKEDPDFNKNYYFPFYRYATNDYKIGFREFIASVLRESAAYDLDDGFIPLYNKFGNIGINSMPNEIIESNRNFKKIDSMCKKNGINVVYFSSPVCKGIRNVEYFDKLKSKISGFKDYSRLFEQDSLFYNCTHLNTAGARLFTERLSKDLEL